MVDRDFTATRPIELWVRDFTYAATWRGFVYVAFVIGVFARRIVGWCASAALRADFVLDAVTTPRVRSCAHVAMRPNWATAGEFDEVVLSS